jgi:hypothetical protein
MIQHCLPKTPISMHISAENVEFHNRPAVVLLDLCLIARS